MGKINECKRMSSHKSNIGISGLLGIGSRFEGEIRFDGILRIDGFMTGRIVCKSDSPSTVIISERAIVDADIVADVIIISGKTLGSIYGIERVEIHAPGRLEGKVFTCDLMIGDGALFQGQSIMLRHLSMDEKKCIKYDGMKQIYNENLIEGKQQSIIDPSVIEKNS